ncbi:hypothetical protein DVH24_011101 [Malus domestica]|uniref:Uncharacterized protein n=1 Tax=Malus domestica TaxID=3750 RepID=A0A498JUN6_MALDO|nr:hypothetical protein DVH24_011101 [Malus domestica]
MGDWVFRVCDFSLKPAKTCVFKEIRFFGFLTFLCSLRRPLYLSFLTRDLRHHCYTKLADGVPLSQTRRCDSFCLFFHLEVRLLVLLGDVGAGKSSLVLRFVKEQFVEFQRRAK